MFLFAAGLFFLDLVISGLKFGVGFARCQDFFNKCLLSFLACQAATVVVGWAFDEGAYLGILWEGVFASVLLDCDAICVSGCDQPGEPLVT